jgi:signal transduction histidine kinase
MRPADEILMNVHPEDKLAIRQALDAIRQRSQPFDLIHRVILPNQELRWIHSKGGVLYDSEGRPARLFGVVFDVTSRIQQEHQLNDTLKQLQEERTVRERFVSTLSHDLRNPLSVIASCSELILRQKADPLVKRLTTQISRNSRRADQMISNLLDANRISSGESLLLSLENLSLRKMISVLIEDLAAVHGNRFVLDMESELSGYWNADAIRRIVENLANNAVKYGASDRPITLRVAQQGADALLSVQNFGKTLSRAEQASLFRPYQRTVDAQFSGKKGWGLGLTLVRGLAEAHGGSVWVESHVGRGTTFYVRLPLDARPYQTGEQTDRENTDLQRPA